MTIIAGEAAVEDRQGSICAVGSKSHVDIVEPACIRIPGQGRDQDLRDTMETLHRAQLFGLRFGLAHEHQVDVGAERQLAPPQLAHAEDGAAAVEALLRPQVIADRVQHGGDAGFDVGGDPARRRGRVELARQDRGPDPLDIGAMDGPRMLHRLVEIVPDWLGHWRAGAEDPCGPAVRRMPTRSRAQACGDGAAQLGPA